MSDTSHLKYPVWLWLDKWPSHFTTKDYTLSPLVRFCTNSTSAPSPIPELEQGLWDWARDHSWSFYSNCSSTWKEQDWVGVTWDSAFTFSQDWTHHMEIIPKLVLGRAEHPFCLWTSSGKHSHAAVQWPLYFHRCLKYSMFVLLEQEGELPGTRPKQRQGKSAQISVPHRLRVHWGGPSLYGIPRWS